MDGKQKTQKRVGSNMPNCVRKQWLWIYKTHLLKDRLWDKFSYFLAVTPEQKEHLNIRITM
jgi:hypothetical protein